MSKVGLMVTTIAFTCAFASVPVIAETAAAPTTAPAATVPATPAAAPTAAPVTAPAAPAATTDTTTKPAAAPASTDIPKDTWLNQMLPMLPELICKGFLGDDNLKKRFNELKITYEQCVANIPAISAKCKDQIYAKIPATINNESAATWGRSIGECIGRNYAEQYLVPK
jgi:hypothetical protein